MTACDQYVSGLTILRRERSTLGCLPFMRICTGHSFSALQCTNPPGMSSQATMLHCRSDAAERYYCCCCYDCHCKRASGVDHRPIVMQRARARVRRCCAPGSSLLKPGVSARCMPGTSPASGRMCAPNCVTGGGVGSDVNCSSSADDYDTRST